MATVKEINHDSSTTLSDFYGTIFDPDGAYTVIPGAALNGTTNGVQADYDAGTQNARLTEAFTDLVGAELRWRFRVDLTGMTNASSSSDCIEMQIRNGGVASYHFVILGNGTTGFELKLFYFDDSTGSTQIGSNIALSNGDTCIECRAIRETTDGDADGVIQFFINGVSQAFITNAENFVNFAVDDNRIRIFSNVGAFTGTLKYDEFILDDDDMASLGCGFSGYDLVLGGGQP